MPSRQPANNGDFTPPDARAMRRQFALARAYFAPQFIGIDKLQLNRPALWVGNHTLYGLTDVPLLIEHLYTQHGILLRSLGDRGHFNLPFWGDMLVRNGMVLGTPDNCAALMQAGQHVLVFPGGGREVMRRKGEKYNLIWKQRSGFARLAIEHGYDIIPLAAVGADDAFDIVLDADDVSRSRLWQMASRRLPLETLTRNGDMIPPLARGLGWTLVPRPQRYYFSAGKRISTRRQAGKADDAECVWSLRERVASALAREIDRLKAHRETDQATGWSRLRRWLAPIHD